MRTGGREEEGRENLHYLFETQLEDGEESLEEPVSFEFKEFKELKEESKEVGSTWQTINSDIKGKSLNTVVVVSLRRHSNGGRNRVLGA